MPINDSAGVGVYLEDKSQRATTTVGFRSAGSIEADRGLCETPVLISSETDYVKKFGSPDMSRHGRAAMEAYMLAQRGVPQVLTRALDPELAPTDRPFGSMTFALENGDLVVTKTSASAIGAPADEDTTILYFKGQGDYAAKAKGNIVLRFSEPATQSAYAKSGQPVRVQVFDFNGDNHIDEDTEARFAFNPDVNRLVSPEGALKLDGYVIGGALASDAGESETVGKVKVTTFINGRVGKDEFDYSALYDGGNDWGIFDRITKAAQTAIGKDGKPIIDSSWPLALKYAPDTDIDAGSGSGSSNLGIGQYYVDSTGTDEHGRTRQLLNCFNLSASVSIEAVLPVAAGTKPMAPGFYTYPCGSVTISTDRTGASPSGYVAKFSINTSLYLYNRNGYMYMGPQNEFWASYYQSYSKESFVFSFSYEDYDSNYLTMQADAVLNASDYLVPKTSENFGGYTIDYATSDLTNELQYFSDDIAKNEIGQSNKSYAYSTALSGLLADNLVKWRCIVTPNLGDVMISGDFISAITAAGETTLGLSNLGKAASVDFFGNTEGRHGNRFIADFSQYGYRTLDGKRTPVTMASLVVDLLNQHYNNGIEARPPFGYTYGQVACNGLSQEFTGAERAVVARTYKVNPVIEDGGYYLWDERTSQLTETALSDEHCIISFLWMKYDIYDSMKSFVAEYNDEATVNRGLSSLGDLNRTFIARNYIEEGIPSADKNVIGDEVLRFDYAVRFKGVARYVDVYITAYSQTQSLAISLAEDA